MTQRERVLQMLKDAGPRGIRSDAFIKDFMPRAAARVQELKEQGYEISSEREGKYTRWTLTNVGIGAEDSESVSGLSRSGLASQSAISTDSGVEHSASRLPSRPGASDAPPANPYEYEVWAAQVPELPYVNFYCSDWLGDSKVRRMGAEARGIHIDLICHSWQEPLPSDKDVLAEMLGVQRRKLDSLWSRLAPCWAVDGDHLVNKRLEKEREKQRKKRGEG